MFLNYRNQENVLNRYFILMLVAVLSLAPFIYMVLVSFMSLGEATNIRILLPSELRFENYAKAWQQARFSNYFFNSVLVTLSTLIGQLVICSLAGYAFAVIRFRGHQIVFMLVLITLMVPESVLISPALPDYSWTNRSNRVFECIFDHDPVFQFLDPDLCDDLSFE